MGLSWSRLVRAFLVAGVLSAMPALSPLGVASQDVESGYFAGRWEGSARKVYDNMNHPDPLGPLPRGTQRLAAEFAIGSVAIDGTGICDITLELTLIDERGTTPRSTTLQLRGFADYKSLWAQGGDPVRPTVFVGRSRNSRAIVGTLLTASPSHSSSTRIHVRRVEDD